MLRAAFKQVTDRTTNLVRLQVELAQAEMREKAQLYGLGIGLGVGAAVFALFGLGFLFAASAIGLAYVLPWWAAVLIVGVVLLFVAVMLGLFAKKEIAKAGKPVPEAAIGEARLTAQAIRANGSR